MTGASGSVPLMMTGCSWGASLDDDGSQFERSTGGSREPVGAIH